ncbi:MAG TPA: PspC domain-containing protein [Ottowia sp.]|uniref:PspC domain-containing protein n=1 Tax=Ottowia sp. TaxID=1898956 RepID=UPI002BEA10C2|nr:PspC domain-containing protein [Ottowia sp.]HMN21829.1 PspC domain-containing protein [Ottowia sp.]
MSLADDLTRLDELRRNGALSQVEFERAKARLLEPGEPAVPPAALSAVNRLRRSRDDRWIAGVCGGLAQATGLDSWAWRLAFALLLLLGGTGLVVYLLLWIFVPPQ